jgi:hypothetical protein
MITWTAGVCRSTFVNGTQQVHGIHVHSTKIYTVTTKCLRSATERKIV